MSNSYKSCIVFPPQWTPFNPHFALYTLAGYLKGKDIPLDILDANLAFYNEILSAEFIENLIKEYNVLLNSLIKKKKDATVNEEEEKKLRFFIHFFSEQPSFTKGLAEKVSKFTEILKSKTDFYDPMKLNEAFLFFDKYFEFISIAYMPANLHFTFYIDRRFTMDFASILNIIKSNNTQFHKFIDKYVQDVIIPQNYNMIAFSINTDTQLTPGLYMAYVLKKHYQKDVHLSIGGNYFTRLTDVIEKETDFFKLYADSMIWGEGEIPLEQLITSLRDQTDLNNVNNLIYWDEASQTIKKTTEQPWQQHLDHMGTIDLSQLDLNGYLTPEIVLPIQSSRGCYWGKCTFCDHFYGANVSVKSLDNVMRDIYQAREYGITKFVFIDEMLSPSFVKRFSTRVIEENLQITWFTNGRPELGFNEEVLGLASQAGCKMIMCGIESGCDRINTLINKGVDIQRRFEPLKIADSHGIWNFAFIFFAYPTETVKEAFQTVRMILDDNSCIDSYGQSVFTPGKHSLITKEPERFGITKLYYDESQFATWVNYETVAGMRKGPMNAVRRYLKDLFLYKHHNYVPVWFKFSNRDTLFLYLSRYGKQKIKRWHFKDLKNFKYGKLDINDPSLLIEGDYNKSLLGKDNSGSKVGEFEVNQFNKNSNQHINSNLF
ncbi:MAG: hypothetical protein A2Y40_04785 [Candidatus Margulisbacteria bacterium GWF2_35_9]|nr:MAG: hypothetical protein A2Y40_04785 [Candidatus Margulisbacteria bacterium GWF2_35_9]